MPKLLHSLCLSLGLLMAMGIPASAQALASVQQRSPSANVTTEPNQVSLKSLLVQLESNFAVRFNYRAAVVRSAKVSARPMAYFNEGMTEQLNQLLAPLELLCVEIDARTFVIREKRSVRRQQSHGVEVPRTDGARAEESVVPPADELKIPELAVVPDRTIAGRVSDAVSGEGLPGVNILLKGTQQGTTTDAEGTFKVTVSNDEAVLVFSFVGYVSQEIVVGSRTNLDVSLIVDEKSLEEVVVVGYGTQKKVNLTGAVSSVGSEVLESRPIPNLGQGLQGMIPNLNITQSSGTIGGGASFNVRGFTSINGGEPLILVNNVPQDINLINPNDIESITVLKDAASAAIYGARAAYGVILITTKTGKKSDKPRISLSSNYSVNKPTVIFKAMDVLERMDYMNTANMAANGVPYYQFTDMYKEKILAHYHDPSQPAAFPDPNNPNKWLMSGNTDWSEWLLRDSYPQQQHMVSVSGGSDKIDYYSSLGYFNQKGMAKQFNENYDRYNFVTNIDYNINKWARVGTNIMFSKESKIWGPLFPEADMSYQLFQWPNWPVFAPDGNYAIDGTGVPNMVQLQREGGYQSRDKNYLWLTGKAKLTPIRNLSFNIDYSFNATNIGLLNYYKRLPKYYVDGTIYDYYPGTNPSQVGRTTHDNRYYVFNAFADYTNKFGKHELNAIIGFNQENALNSSFSARRTNLTVEDIPFMRLASGEQFATDNASEYAIRGAFSRLSYNYDDRYFLEYNGRYDGSSKFPKSNRFEFFPSASVGWRVDNEAFFARLRSVISMFKIRASYGKLGNQSVASNYPYVASYGSGEVNYLIGGRRPMTVYAPALVSPVLTWETVTQRNLGFDVSLWDNRLNGSLDFYRRDTKNMLTRSQTLPAVLAVGEPLENAANLKTTGFDLSLSWKERGKKVNYAFTFLLSDNTSEITKFSNPTGLIADYYVGKSIGEIWGFSTGGIFQTDEEARALDQTNISGRQRRAGDLFFEDLNGDGKITYGRNTLDDPGDRKVIGNNTARYSFGLRSEVEWKGFDLVAFFQGIAKRDLQLNGTFWVNAYADEWAVQNKVITDWWSPENPDAYFPRPLIVGGSDVIAAQTRYLQNGAYMRLKQLTLGYRIPADVTRRLGIDRLRVYFSGNNVWEISNIYKRVADPEMNNIQNNPINRSISFGLDISF